MDTEYIRRLNFLREWMLPLLKAEEVERNRPGFRRKTNRRTLSFLARLAFKNEHISAMFNRTSFSGMMRLISEAARYNHFTDGHTVFNTASGKGRGMVPNRDDRYSMCGYEALTTLPSTKAFALTQPRKKHAKIEEAFEALFDDAPPSRRAA
jgi:hypothetical protein